MPSHQRQRPRSTPVASSASRSSSSAAVCPTCHQSVGRMVDEGRSIASSYEHGGYRYSRPSSSGGRSASSAAAPQRGGGGAARRYSVETPRGPPSKMALKAVVGYSSHIPGVEVGNITGRSFRSTNKRAAAQVREQQQGLSGKGDRTFRPPSRGRAPESSLYPSGASVPGYAGFIPGIIAGNLVATSTPRAVKDNWSPSHPTTSLKIGAYE